MEENMKKINMKKANVMVIMGMILAMLTGCGQSENVISGEVNNSANLSQKEENAGQSQNQNQNENQSQNQNQESEAEDAASESYKGYAFISKDVVIEMDEEAAPIIEALGEPLSYFEAASCAFEGLDKIYTYSGFEINTYPGKDKDYISSVILKDDSVTTVEGVAIGDSKEKLEQVYGTECTVEENLMIYEKDDMKLRFIVKDGVIEAIEYVSNVL